MGMVAEVLRVHSDMHRGWTLLEHGTETDQEWVEQVFPDSFRQLQCYVLVGDVLEVMEKLMLHMTEFRQGLFFAGAAQHFITIHIQTRYKVPAASSAKSVFMLAAVLSAPDHLASTRITTYASSAGVANDLPATGVSHGWKRKACASRQS